MPNLDSLIRWQPYAPDLGENRESKRPFYVELAVGLTKADLAQLGESVSALAEEPADAANENKGARTEDEMRARLEADADTLARALTPWVRLGKEPLSVNGEAVDTLPKLLRLYTRISGGAVAMLELATALRFFNTAGGKTQLFFERLSGGSVSTTPTGRAAR